jgi:hypothetical protein
VEKKKIILPQPEIEPLFLGRLAGSPVAVLTELFHLRYNSNAADKTYKTKKATKIFNLQSIYIKQMITTSVMWCR